MPTLSFSRIKNYFKVKYLVFALLIIVISFLIIDDFYAPQFKKGDPNTLVVGMECDYYPYNYMAQYNKQIDQTYLLTANNRETKSLVAGYDILVSKLLAKHLNKKLVIKAISFDGLIPACQNGDIDLIIAGMSATKKEKKKLISLKNLIMIPIKLIVLL
ncbi:transporter substrate-binding domain-containing protein [Candidatus Phytoplasma australiense]|uniref:transporter substrate-binding domain-containing protein n=1 Tax=Phytoplasma australiense TaxID=59748 RepID=UPI0003A08E25|nr:transporter substrate-binding domain-containing protein [Candidatus Phytoplasma australiense]